MASAKLVRWGLLASLIVLAGCFAKAAGPPETVPGRNALFQPSATVVALPTQPLPTMAIWIPALTPPAGAAPASPTATPTPPDLPDEPRGHVAVDDLALPFDPDEVAALLRSDPRYRFRYKHRAFVFANCATLAYLGEAMEVYAHFNEGDPKAPPPPSFSVYAPADMRILKVWGTNRYRLALNGRIGLNERNKPSYLSLLSLSRLQDGLRAELARLLSADPLTLALDYADPSSTVGPYLFTAEYAVDADDARAPQEALQMAPSSVIVNKGDLVGFKEGPWEWYPTCGTEHTLSIHVHQTTNDPADQSPALETGVPALTYHYLNLVVRELVIKRGVSIEVEYRARNIGSFHERLAHELFAPDVLAQVTLIPWLDDRHPRRFTVAPGHEEAVPFFDEKE